MWNPSQVAKFNGLRKTLESLGDMMLCDAPGRCLLSQKPRHEFLYVRCFKALFSQFPFAFFSALLTLVEEQWHLSGARHDHAVPLRRPGAHLVHLRIRQNNN